MPRETNSGGFFEWSLRGIPYTAATAAADIIDNSIAALAKNIWVVNRAAANPMESYVAFADDGHGMSDVELRRAMLYGSNDPRADRGAGDLGRFGLGMKTASLSQGLCLTVWSKKSGHAPAVRQFDLESQTAESRGIDTEPQRLTEREALNDVLRKTGLEAKDSGTVVLWSGLDVMLELGKDSANLGLVDADSDRAGDELPIHVRLMNKRVTEILEHAQCVFHRFLAPIDGRPKRLTISRVFDDGSMHRCAAWDPFLQGKQHENIPVERPPQQKVLRGKAGEATVQPVILPHESNVPVDTFASLRLSNRNMNSLQGFYVYRQERLIVIGDWLGLYAPEIHYQLGRIALFLGNDKESDSAWSIKINKDSVQIPNAARQEIERIAKSTRKRSNDVFRRVGRVRSRSSEASKTTVQIWIQRRVDLDGKRHLQMKLNRMHPLIKAASKDSRNLGALLSAVEGGLPYEEIQVLLSDGEKLSTESDPAVALGLLKEAVEIMADDGESPCDTLLRVSKDLAPYNSESFHVAVGLLRAELGCKPAKRGEG